MKNLALLLAFLFTSIFVSAQENYFVPTKVGTVMVYKYYDSKGKPEKIKKSKEDMWVRYTVQSVEERSDTTYIQMKMESNLFENNTDMPQQLAENLQSVTFKLHNNTLYLDNTMQNLDQLLNNNAAGMKSKSDASSTLPVSLSVGQTLPNQTVMKHESKIDAGFMKMTMKIEANHINRKVETQEDLSTAAGTFNCYKLTYQNQIKSDMGKIKSTINENTIEWLSPELGVVKSERYDEKGKLIQTRILEELHYNN